MNRRLAMTCLILIGLLFATAASAQGPHTPPAGSRERQAILDAARVKVGADLRHRGPLLFQVYHLKVYRGWALLQGQPLDGTETPIHKDCEDADEDTMVLLQHRAEGWVVVRGGTVCTTDVYYLSWPRETGAPREIFPGDPAGYDM
jgi:hypothetical protein